MKSDIGSILCNIAALMQPVAKANFVTLQAQDPTEPCEMYFQPDTLLCDLARLLCRIITYTPQNYAIVLAVARETPGCSIRIRNTGPYLGKLPGITEDCAHPVSVSTAPDGGTIFNLSLGEDLPPSNGENMPHPEPDSHLFFQKFRQHLQHYSTQLTHLEKIAQARSERDGVFLQKVNAHLLANLDREDFTLTNLCKALALSRAQFYRRLTSLVNMPPSQYIRLFRMSKAKEYLENQTWSVAEVGFRVGFKDKSHFSRAFRKHFGFNPSHYRRGEPVMAVP